MLIVVSQSSSNWVAQQVDCAGNTAKDTQELLLVLLRQAMFFGVDESRA